MQGKYISFRAIQLKWNTLSLQKLSSNSKYAAANKPAAEKTREELWYNLLCLQSAFSSIHFLKTAKRSVISDILPASPLKAHSGKEPSSAAVALWLCEWQRRHPKHWSRDNPHLCGPVTASSHSRRSTSWTSCPPTAGVTHGTRSGGLNDGSSSQRHFRQDQLQLVLPNIKRN